MTTTTQVRNWWDPACKANVQSLTAAYEALDAVLKKWNYKPRSGVTGAFNCRKITGGTGYSLHAYDPDGFFTFWTGVRVTKALAVDINWDTNPYGRTLVTDMPLKMVQEIQAIKTVDGLQVWRSGRFYSGNKDAMHFEIIVSPAQLARGIKKPTATKPTPAPAEEEDDMPTLKPLLLRLTAKDSAVLYMSVDRTVRHIPNKEAMQGYQLDMQMNGLSPDVCVLSAIDDDKGNLDELYDFVVSLPWIGPMPARVKAVWKGPVIS